MTVSQFQADRIENAGRLLAHFVQSTPPEKRNWVPSVEGAAGLRSVLDMVSECIHVNRMFAALIRGESVTPFNPIEAARPFARDDEAIAQLTESAKALAEAVRAMTDADLDREFVTRRGPMPGASVIELPYRNMAYHGGQVNLIQLLYGDTEFHIPTPSAK